jgi:very-short-patch-repair endonuclease
MNQLTKVFDDQQLTIIEIENEPYFRLGDVCKILELGQVAGVKRRLDQNNLFWHPVIDSMGRRQQAIFVNKKGLLDVIYNSRKPEALEIAETLGFKVIKATKEQEYIQIIKNAFSHYESVTQYRVLGYNVDLYLPELQLAIECDEHGHKYYTRSDQDGQRQSEIENYLGCRFIRFNPDEPGFNIGKVINEIMLEVHEVEPVI